MPRNRSQGTGGGITTTTETVIGTLSGVSLSANSPIDLDATCDITGGTGATSVTLRIRRGTDTTGPVVGQAVQCNIAATVRDTRSIQATDTPANDLAGASYVVTAQQAGASGNGISNSCYISAIW